MRGLHDELVLHVAGFLRRTQVYLLCVDRRLRALVSVDVAARDEWVRIRGSDELRAFLEGGNRVIRFGATVDGGWRSCMAIVYTARFFVWPSCDAADGGCGQRTIEQLGCWNGLMLHFDEPHEDKDWPPRALVSDASQTRAPYTGVGVWVLRGNPVCGVRHRGIRVRGGWDDV